MMVFRPQGLVSCRSREYDVNDPEAGKSGEKA